MASKSKSSGHKMKESGGRAVPEDGYYVEIEVCEPDDAKVHASVNDYIIWINTDNVKCHVKFSDEDDGCPLDDCEFDVPGSYAPDRPGRYPTKVVTGKGESFRYRSRCCHRTGQPKIIID